FLDMSYVNWQIRENCFSISLARGKVTNAKKQRPGLGPCQLYFIHLMLRPVSRPGFAKFRQSLLA
ncbi:hypothetical protein, partial [Limosilactobacillus ingluviei]|uniref:hypothetical protein n=1 Tax=Limosilactobacillus ingluviei TaxID=148604 RepID=UPI0019553982